MISWKKKSAKRIWFGIILSLFSAALAVFILTKVIYDGSFRRYDTAPAVPAALTALVDTREQVFFHNNGLCGYLYPGDGEGLIVFVPGYHALADSYLWQIHALQEKGWAVFCFDATGSGRSGGDSAVGFSQILYDLEAALDYVEARGLFGYEKVYLMGHSRGGYAVCGVLDKGYDIAAAVSVSGVNSCMEAVLQPAADRIGLLSYGNYPMLWLYQAALFGSDAVNTDAAEKIAGGDTPVLVIQGANDARFTEDKYSVYAHCKDEQAPNAYYYLCSEPGQDGHTDLLFDSDGSANDKLMAEIDRFFSSY